MSKNLNSCRWLIVGDSGWLCCWVCNHHSAICKCHFQEVVQSQEAVDITGTERRTLNQLVRSQLMGQKRPWLHMHWRPYNQLPSQVEEGSGRLKSMYLNMWPSLAASRSRNLKQPMIIYHLKCRSGAKNSSRCIWACGSIKQRWRRVRKPHRRRELCGGLSLMLFWNRELCCGIVVFETFQGRV